MSPALPTPAGAQNPDAGVCLATYRDAMLLCAREDRNAFPGSGAPSCTDRANAQLNTCLAPSAAPLYTLEADPGEISLFDLDDLSPPFGSGAGDPDPKFAGALVLMRDTGLPGSLRADQPETAWVGRSLVIAAPVPVDDPDAYFDAVHLLTLIAADGDRLDLDLRVRAPLNGPQGVDESHGCVEIECDPDDFPTIVAPARIRLEGLTPDLYFEGSDVVIGMDNDVPLAPEATRGYIVSGLDENSESESASIDLKRFFTYDPARNAFVLSRGDIADFRETLAPGIGVLYIEFGVPPNTFNENGGFDYRQDGVLPADWYEFFYINSDAEIRGRLVNRNGDPVAGAAVGDLEVMVEAVNSRFRAVVPVAADGTFTVPGVYSGETFRLTLTDLRAPNGFQIFSALPPDATGADVELVYDPSVFGLAQWDSSAPAFHPPAKNDAPYSHPHLSRRKLNVSGIRGKGGHTRTDGTVSIRPDHLQGTARDESPPHTRRTSVTFPTGGEIKPMTGPGCAKSIENGVRLKVTTSGEGKSEVCNISITASSDITSLRVSITTITNELPGVTQHKSDFGDAWSYTLAFPGTDRPLKTDGGVVHKTHSGRSLVDSFSVSALATTSGASGSGECGSCKGESANMPITVLGSLSAQNVGDSKHHTTVEMEIK